MRYPTGVRCSACGLGEGTIDTETSIARCSCGRFAERTSDYCAKHGVNIAELTGYDECPKCRREEERDALERELQARRSDPQMHNMVDAQANAIDHSRPRGP
jgi:hypothetical protein